jgi:membrane associated rhomboid family serine protease/Zn-finger nucleic acid-binding protein
MAYLRRFAPHDVLRRIWRIAWDKDEPDGHVCPSCRLAMCRVTLPGAELDLQLDVCRRCHLIWFDAEEMERLIPHDPKAERAWLRDPSAARRMELAARSIAKSPKAESGETRGYPVLETILEHWYLVPGVFGLPWEEDAPVVQIRPWATWGVGLAVLLLGILALFDLEGAVATLGLIPDQPFRLLGLTFWTSFFVHGGVFHLLSNLYFLVVFGDNVEETVGSKRFLLLLAASTLAGGVLHVLLDPRGHIPCVGASGGISGILAYYALTFPGGKVGFLRFFGFIPLLFRIPVALAFALWVGLQVLLASLQSSGFTGVSAYAHLGGAGVGIVSWILMRARR